MRAEVQQRMHARLGLQPQVERDISMPRRQCRIMVGLAAVLGAPAFGRIATALAPWLTRLFSCEIAVCTLPWAATCMVFCRLWHCLAVATSSV